MGYITEYYITVYDKDKRKLKTNSDTAYLIEGKLSDIAGYDLKLQKTYDLKWYDSDVNIEEISKQYPDLYFFLEGNGEASGDIWKNIYQNGKCIKQWSLEPTTYPDFKTLINE